MIVSLYKNMNGKGIYTCGYLVGSMSRAGLERTSPAIKVIDN